MKQRGARWRWVGLGLTFISAACAEARDAATGTPDDGDVPAADVGSPAASGDPTSAGASECLGRQVYQSIQESGYVVREQVELDALAGCVKIRGSLRVEFPDADLRPLQQLREIDGLLAFNPPPGGEPHGLSLIGLEQLERIGLSLSLGSVLVQSLEPLAGLRSIGASVDPDDWSGAGLVISGCSELESLAPLSGLTTPVESLALGYNEKLRSITGPPLAERMQSVFIGNVGAVDLSPLLAVREIAGLNLADSDVPNLDFLASLERADRIELRGSLVQDIGGLTGLVSNERLSITFNFELKRVPAFPRLVTAQLIQISNNPVLELIEGFPALTALDDSEFQTGLLEVVYNEELRGVSGLGALQSAHEINVIKNPRLRELDFEALERATSLRLNSNPELAPASLSFVPGVTADFVKVAGNAGDPLLLDPCPFVDDGVCDAAPYDTLCADASDERDCNALH